MLVSPCPCSCIRAGTVNRRSAQDSRRLEVAREGGRAGVPESPQRGFRQIGTQLAPGELRRLDRRGDASREAYPRARAQHGRKPAK